MAKKPYDHLFKILLIGDSGVGKTCLICRFCDDNFRDSFIATIGIDFKIKTVEIEGKKIRLQIWDTAGQERFHTITVSYYRNAHAVLLVYDVTCRDSFENVVNWMRQVKQNASSGVELLLVGNKTDLEERRVIAEERGKHLAHEHGMAFIETSAKNGHNVEKAFRNVAGALLENPNLIASTSRLTTRAIRVEPAMQETTSGYGRLSSLTSSSCC